MDVAALPRILAVDDDQALLDGLRRQLRGQFDIVIALGGRDGLARLGDSGPFAVVLSDYQMPHMDGATFLAAVRQTAPESTRVMLTGQADLSGAARAINEGGAFRMLLKPITRSDLVTALSAGVDQYHLVTAERDLLERTLRGSVRALTEVLSLACPQAFARATRMRRVADLMLSSDNTTVPWHVDLAVMLSQVGVITLPPSVLDKLDGLGHLRPEEEEMLARLPELADRVLADIPRLEDVRAAILGQDMPFSPDPSDKWASPPRELPTLGARVLRIVRDYDGYSSAGYSASDAVSLMRATAYRYDPQLLDTLAQAVETTFAQRVTAMQVHELATRMTLADDVYTKTGVKLVSRGQETTVGLVERIRNFARMPAGIQEPIMVFVPTVQNAVPSS